MPAPSSVHTARSHQPRPPRPPAPPNQEVDLSMLDLGTAGPGRYPTIQQLRVMADPSRAREEEGRMGGGGNMAGVGAGAKSWYVARERGAEEAGRQRPQTMPVGQLQRPMPPPQYVPPSQPPPAHSPPRAPHPQSARAPSIAPTTYSAGGTRQPPPSLNDFRRPTVTPVMPAPLALQHPVPQHQHQPNPQQHIHWSRDPMPTPRPVVPPLYTPVAERPPPPPPPAQATGGFFHRRQAASHPPSAALARSQTSAAASAAPPVHAQQTLDRGPSTAVQSGHRVLRKKGHSPPPSPPRGPAPGTQHTSTAADLSRARTVPARVPPIVTFPRPRAQGVVVRQEGRSQTVVLPALGGGGRRAGEGEGEGEGSPEEYRGWNAISTAREPATPATGFGAGGAGWGGGEGGGGGRLRVINVGMEDTPVDLPGSREPYARFGGPEDLERRVGDEERRHERVVRMPEPVQERQDAEDSLERFQALAGIQTPTATHHPQLAQQQQQRRRQEESEPSALPYLQPSPRPPPPPPPPFTPSAQAQINRSVNFSPPTPQRPLDPETQALINRAVEYDVPLPAHVDVGGAMPFYPELVRSRTVPARQQQQQQQERRQPELTVFRAQPPPAPVPAPSPARPTYAQRYPHEQEYTLPSGHTRTVQYDVPYRGSNSHASVTSGGQRPLVVFRPREPAKGGVGLGLGLEGMGGGGVGRRESVVTVVEREGEGRRVLRKRQS